MKGGRSIDRSADCQLIRLVNFTDQSSIEERGEGAKLIYGCTKKPIAPRCAAAFTTLMIAVRYRACHLQINRLSNVTGF